LRQTIWYSAGESCRVRYLVHALTLQLDGEV
jgi:hypothetical protein